MAGKISEMSDAGTLTGTEKIEVMVPGSPNLTRSTTLVNIANFAFSPFLEGSQFIYSANVAGYASSSFAVQIANWGGLSTTAGTIQSPTYSFSNKVQAIPREVRRAASGASNDTGWGLGTGTGNPNSVNFPGGLNDAGFYMQIIGGIDANVSTLSTTEFLYGAAFTSGGLPASGVAITQSASAWFGVYSEAGSTDIKIGYKPTGTTTISALTSHLSSFSWAANQGWRLSINVDPRTSPPTTTWLLEELTAVGTFTTISSGTTTAWNPGRLPMSPNYRFRKTTSGDVLDAWISSVFIRSYFLGAASL